jgi:UDP-N-acetylmuramoyl-tripeptide--D-alanyl-D-alanine ligase
VALFFAKSPNAFSLPLRSFDPVERTALYSAFLEARSVCTDTRTLLPGDLYFALKGPNFNGNRFAAKALESGASLVVLDEPPTPESLRNDPRVLLVPDVLQALQELARTHRRSFEFPVFALTGSNGKTTTKELLAAALSQRYRVGFTQGNLNNHIGVPLTLLRLPADTEFAVIEMGANAQREIAGLCAIAEPDAGLITNIGDAHLEGFGGRAGVKKGKGELFDFLRERGGTIFCWTDSSDLVDLAAHASRVVEYGSGPGCAVRGVPITGGLFAAVSLHFQEPFPEAVVDVHSQLVGGYNGVNLVAAACVAAHYGVSPQSIRQGLEQYRSANQRSEWRKHGSNTLYLDAYNANPTSMREALLSLGALPVEAGQSGTAEDASGDGAADPLSMQARGGKGAILGDMLELGDYSRAAHQEIADLAGSLGLNLLVFIGPEFAQVQRPGASVHFEDSAAAAAWLQNQPVSDCVLLLKGSRGIGVERVLESLR